VVGDLIEVSGNEIDVVDPNLVALTDMEE